MICIYYFEPGNVHSLQAVQAMMTSLSCEQNVERRMRNETSLNSNGSGTQCKPYSVFTIVVVLRACILFSVFIFIFFWLMVGCHKFGFKI